VFGYLTHKVAPTMREAKAASAQCKARRAELEAAQLEQESLVVRVRG